MTATVATTAMATTPSFESTTVAAGLWAYLVLHSLLLNGRKQAKVITGKISIVAMDYGGVPWTRYRWMRLDMQAMLRSSNRG
jgi:hypothetical protein